MPIILDFFAIGLVSFAAIAVVKTIVLSTPLKNIPGLGMFVGVV